MCLEPLLEVIEKNIGGININEGNKVSVLAFADDIVLLGENTRAAQSQIDELQKYLERSGHENISREKSNVPGNSEKDTWFIKDPAIKIGKLRIPGRIPERAFRYLGAKVGSGGGMR